MTPEQPTPNLCPHSPPPPPPHARTHRSLSHRPPLPAARPKQLLGLTWHTGTKLVWEFGDEVIVNSVLRRPQDDHRPRIVNCEHKPHCETRSALQEAPCKFISSWTCSKSFWSDPDDLCGQANAAVNASPHLHPPACTRLTQGRELPRGSTARPHTGEGAEGLTGRRSAKLLHCPGHEADSQDIWT